MYSEHDRIPRDQRVKTWQEEALQRMRECEERQAVCDAIWKADIGAVREIATILGL